jgi:hypothetical protein
MILPFVQILPNSALRDIVSEESSPRYGRRSIINETPPGEIYFLPLALAYAVLDQVLDELAAQGKVLSSREKMLGTKIQASRRL